MNRGIDKGLNGEAVRSVLDILLFAVNFAGIVGALSETLLADWRGGFHQPFFWGGLALISAASVLWWRGWSVQGGAGYGRSGHKGFGQGRSGSVEGAYGKTGKKRRNPRILWGTMGIALIYASAVFWFRETIVNGLVWSFRNGLGLFHEYYGGEGALWQSVAELLQRLSEDGGVTVQDGTLCLLAVLFPVGMLTGFIYNRGKWQVFLAEDVVWFTAACITDVFPGNLFLVLCVMGLVLAMAVGEFGGSVTAWVQAAAGITALAFLGTLLIQWLLLPVLDGQYAGSAPFRHEVYVTVNYKWLPEVQKFFRGSGFGAGVDVTGAFGRQSRASGITSEVYRVTLAEAPRRTLYLRGFVGMGYDRRRWQPEEEGALERYYQAHDFLMYEEGRELLNMGFAAAQSGAQTNTITIEELLGEGSYSLIPYGVLVTEDYPVHGGGTVDRVDGIYRFRYRDMVTVDLGSYTEQWRTVEEQYRQYVHEDFLDYPEERLPLLTQALEAEGLPRGDVYGCAVAILDFLEENGAYQLDVASTPVGKDFVEHFLFESHQGFCAHFASAAVLMFRYCGIPARYATGYSVSPSAFSRTPENGYTANLTGSQTHAWAEVYVDGVGWVPVEATPGAAAFAGDNRGELLRRLGILTGDLEPTRGTVVYDDDEEDEEEELGEGGKLPSMPYDDEEELEDEEDAGTRTLGAGEIGWIVFVAVLAAAAVTVLSCRIRRLCWNSRLKKLEGREKAFLLYRNMRNALSVMGCSRQLILTGEPFWEELRRTLPSQSRNDYDAICAILEQSSFGKRPPSKKELENLESLHDDMLSRLYLRAPFYRKVFFGGLACVLPASYRTYSLKRFGAD